jgi:hypothetical protein
MLRSALLLSVFLGLASGFKLNFNPAPVRRTPRTARRSPTALALRQCRTPQRDEKFRTTLSADAAPRPAQAKPSAPIAVSRLENIALSRAPTHELRMMISKETAAGFFSVLRAASAASAPTAVTARANLRLAKKAEYWSLEDTNELEFEWTPSISPSRAPKAEPQELEFEWR